MSYLAFLTKLLALGPQLPAVLAIITHIVEDVKQLLALLAGDRPALSASVPYEANQAEAALEAQVVAAVGEDLPPSTRGFAAAGDAPAKIDVGGLLRTLWGFVQNNPALLQLLLSLLTPKAA